MTMTNTKWRITKRINIIRKIKEEPINLLMNCKIAARRWKGRPRQNGSKK